MYKFDLVCNCKAYGFPHRIGAGRCSGIVVVGEQWDNSYGGDSTCSSCMCLQDGNCQVLEGRESIALAGCWYDFLRETEARVSVKYRPR